MTESVAPATIVPNEPYRILHVFRAPVGGLFRHVVDITRLQAEAGHDVGIICDSTTGGERAEQALRDLQPYLRLGVKRLAIRRNPHPTDLSALLSIGKAAKSARAQILHGHGAKGGLFARLAPVRVDGVSPIRCYTPHGGSYNYRPGSTLHQIYMAAERVLALRTDVHLFESEYVAGRHRAYAGAPPPTSRVVHNGIADAEFEPIVSNSDVFDLVYIGELREAKGLPWLLDAVADLRCAGRQLTLLMVGSGPDEARLAEYAARIGLRDVVTFEPPQAIRPVLARGRLMVVPSLAESLPYVLLEAIAARRAVVATNVGGIPEIFGEFGNALVPPRDSDALARAIASALDEAPELAHARVERLGNFVQGHFGMKRMGTEVLSGYAAAFRARDVDPKAFSGAHVAARQTF